MLLHRLSEAIGKTPLLELQKIIEPSLQTARVWAKLEMMNPGMSLKDRTALAMIENAEKKGILLPGGTIIEPTSGNTGISLSWISAVLGYRLILTLPEKMSTERWKILNAYGTEVVFTPWEKGMTGAIQKAKELNQEIPDSIILGQFENESNPQAHYDTTGKEIWEDLKGKVDVFVAGVGTGGCITGVGRFLKEKNPNVEIVAIEPFESAVLSGQKPGNHQIQGIGAGFIPQNYDPKVVDKVRTVRYEDAVQTVKDLAKKEGLLVGVSTGANVFVAKTLASRADYQGKNITTILCDAGERYLSLPFFKTDKEKTK